MLAIFSKDPVSFTHKQFSHGDTIGSTGKCSYQVWIFSALGFFFIYSMPLLNAVVPPRVHKLYSIEAQFLFNWGHQNIPVVSAKFQCPCSSSSLWPSGLGGYRSPVQTCVPPAPAAGATRWTQMRCMCTQQGCVVVGVTQRTATGCRRAPVCLSFNFLFVQVCKGEAPIFCVCS